MHLKLGTATVTVLLACLIGARAAEAQPGAPSGLSASVTGSTVTLSWSAASGAPLTYVIEAGSAPGLSDRASVSTGSLLTTFTATSVPAGTYYVRVRASNAAGISGPSNEVTVVVGCTGPPAAPSFLSADVVATVVTLTWTVPASTTSFRLEAGSAPGLSDRFAGDIGPAASISASVSPGTYYVRVKATNACGTGPASSEITISVGGVGPPTGLIASILGSPPAAVTLQWVAPSAGATPTAYIIEAGSAPGLSDLATFSTGTTATLYTATGIPAGTYYVRVRSAGPGGPSGPSNELRIIVGPPPPGTSTITFGSLTAGGSPYPGHGEAGYKVEPVSGPWTISTTFGHPLPFVQFTRLASEPTTTGVIRVIASGAEFKFVSVELYSSVTPIPFEFTGMLEGGTVYTATGTVPNTFGGFANVPNPFPGVAIDTLLIKLSNPATPCCPNPVGLDNIVLMP